MTKAPMQMHQRFSGGEDATRTHNALRHTTFPMWLLTIRIPLHVALDYYSKHFSKKQEGNFNFLKNFFVPAKRGAPESRLSCPVGTEGGALTGVFC